MPTLFITGANRGIGLELVRQYFADGWKILATCRTPESASELAALADAHADRIEILELEVTDWERTAELGRTLADTPIDLLLANAGIRGRGADDFGTVDPAEWEEAHRVNTIAPVKLVEALLPSLERADKPTVVIVSSIMGSIQSNPDGGFYGYRASKAGANAVTRSLSLDLKSRGVTVVCMHPGWVKTDMGGENAPVEVVESADGMRRVIRALGPEHSGRFFQFDGTELPW